MKKLLALVLAVLMVLSMAACQTKPVETTPPATQGGNDTPTESKETEPPKKDPVTITYWYGGLSELEDTGKVEAKLNEILKTIPGYEYISIDLRPTGSFKKNFELAMADKEQIDLVASYYLDVSALWKDEAILPLDDLLEKYPNVTSQIPEFMVPMGQMYGEQAYIPSAQQATTMYYMRFDTTQFEAYLKDNFMTKDEFREVLQSDGLKTKLDLLEDYTLWVRAYTGSDKHYASAMTNLQYFYSMEYIGSDYGNMIITYPNNKVLWDQMTSEYEYLLGVAADWYERGLIHPDTTIKFTGEIGAEDQLVFSGTTNVATEAMVDDIQKAANHNYTCLAMRDYYYVPSVYAAGGTFIYADSKYPEECMMIMELLHTDLHGDEFYNTLCWGLEGEHYKWIDKETKRIETLEFDGSQGNSSCSYAAWKWQIGNSFNAWKNQAVDDAQNDYINAVHADPTTVPSIALGITWDLEEVDDAVMQLNAINGEYTAASIYALGKDWKTRYDEYVQKMKVAGVDLAVKELNDQLEDYLAEKAK